MSKSKTQKANLYEIGDTKTYSNNSEIKGKKILFNKAVYTILERKNELDKKPPFYLFDLQSKSFLSSLYPSGETNTYIFDTKEGQKYLLRFYANGNYEIEKID